MKKFLLPLAAVLLMASGCTKEYVTKQYVTEQKIIQGMDMSLIDFEVKSEKWAQLLVENLNDDEGYYEAILEVPEITDEVIKKGLVLVYECLEEGIWTPLPAQRTERTTVDGNPFNYSTFTDFEYQKGQVNVFVTTTDLYAGIKPGPKYFRVAVQL